MTVDLDQLEIIVSTLEADSLVLGKIVNDIKTATNPGEEDGTVTTRLGDVVKNTQRILSELENAASLSYTDIYDEGGLVIANPTQINFVGAGVAVTDIAGVPTVTIDGGTPPPYDFGIVYLGTPTSSEIIGRVAMVRAITCPANFAGSAGFVTTSATAAFAIIVNVDGVQIGTINIATDDTYTFTTVGGSAKTINAGSLVTFVAAAVVDATLTNITVTLLGNT